MDRILSYQLGEENRTTILYDVHVAPSFLTYHCTDCSVLSNTKRSTAISVWGSRQLAKGYEINIHTTQLNKIYFSIKTMTFHEFHNSSGWCDSSREVYHQSSKRKIRGGISHFHLWKANTCFELIRAIHHHWWCVRANAMANNYHESKFTKSSTEIQHLQVQASVSNKTRRLSWANKPGTYDYKFLFGWIALKVYLEGNYSILYKGFHFDLRRKKTSHRYSTGTIMRMLLSYIIYPQESKRRTVALYGGKY